MIIFAGSAAASVSSLRAVVKFIAQKNAHNSSVTPDSELIGVLTNPDRKMGRGGEVRPNPLKEAALRMGVNRFWASPEELLTLGEVERPDLGVVVAYGKILKPEILALPRAGWINLHFSVLPNYRGAAPVQSAILAGETETGVSVFQLDEGMDTGPVYLRERVAIEPGENASDLMGRLTIVGAAALELTLERIYAGTAQAQPQIGIPTYSRKFNVADAEIDFAQSAEQVVNQIRAFTYEPGAYFQLNDGVRILVEQARVLERGSYGNQQFTESQFSVPGTFSITKSHVAVTCQNSVVELLKVRPSGKSTMVAADWARGLKSTPRLLVKS
jgi:methionyl-tRNA formyltransferase